MSETHNNLSSNASMYLSVVFALKYLNTYSTASRSEHFQQGSNVTIQCSNKTWSEMIYTIWEISLPDKRCHISSSDEGQNRNTCKDGKTLGNTTRGESNLHIHEFSEKDEGLYVCETVHKGGSYTANIQVSIIVRPKVYTRLETEGSRQEVVCLAERGKPAASITWINTWNSSSEVIETELTSDGFYTVTSRMKAEGIALDDLKNLSCVVTHAFWMRGHTVPLNTTASPLYDPTNSMLLIIISVVTISIVLIVFGGLYFTLRHLDTIRNRFAFNTPTEESKCPPVDDVEEVEPYASYVQRVNIIYDSSADVFK